MTRSRWMLRVLGRRGRLRRPKPLDAVNEQLQAAMAEVAVAVRYDAREPWNVIVNYIAVMQRVAARTPPEVIRDCALTMEVSHHLTRLENQNDDD